MTCTAQRDTFRGWDACILENEFIRLVAVPAIGGRIMAYDLGDYPFFFVDPTLAGKLFTPEENQGDGSLAAWKNYGGDKTWPAPQGWDNDEQWHGPPDPILDTGIYAVDSLHADDDHAEIVMVSPPDPRTRIQIRRSFTIHQSSSRVIVTLSFHNHSEHSVRWGIWDVAQLRAERQNDDGTISFEPGCIVTVPINPNSVFPRGFNIMFGAQDNPQWRVDPGIGLFTAPYQWQIGKVGLDSLAGWIAFANTTVGYAFTESFAHFPNAHYPDGGASVEVWTVGTGEVGNLNYEDSAIYLMETEVLSPLTQIEPKATAVFSINWGACRTDGAILSVTDFGAITQPLSVTRAAENQARVQFCGGVFEVGELRLTYKDATSVEIDSVSFGSVNPLTLISIDRMLKLPTGVQMLELSIGQHQLAHLDMIS